MDVLQYIETSIRTSNWAMARYDEPRHSRIIRSSIKNTELDQHVEQYDILLFLKTLPNILSKRELQILYLHYGLSGKPVRTLKDIGDVMDLSQSRVAQIRDRAFRKVRGAAIRKKLKGIDRR